MKRLLGVALVALLAGCSAATTQTGLATSGQALIGVGNQFVSVAQMYQANCVDVKASGTMANFCSGFKTFAPQFQAQYPNAVTAWKAAVQGNDVAKAQGAEATILTLGASLSALAAQVIGGLK